MRDIKTLLQLVLDNINEERSIHGLCYQASILYGNRIITREEYLCLDDYITNNRPKWYSSWESFKCKGHPFYWKPSNIKPRIKWLKKHIKKNTLRGQYIDYGKGFIS